MITTDDISVNKYPSMAVELNTQQAIDEYNMYLYDQIRIQIYNLENLKIDYLNDYDGQLDTDFILEMLDHMNNKLIPIDSLIQNEEYYDVLFRRLYKFYVIDIFNLLDDELKSTVTDKDIVKFKLVLLEKIKNQIQIMIELGKKDLLINHKFYISLIDNDLNNFFDNFMIKAVQL
jgi:hypothetical protein